MESSWKNTLAQLQAYVKANPGITIAPGIIILPEEVRPGFYSLFDRVENDFVRENFPGFIELGTSLSAAWAAVSQATVDSMKLESLGIAPALRWFLNNPVDGLSRYFSDDLFAILKGEIDPAEFETRNLRHVPPMFAAFFKQGYRRWVQTAILGRLGASKIMRVPAIDEIADPLMGEGHENPGQHVASLPEAVPASSISFEQHPIISFVVPKVLVWSEKAGRYVSMHSEFVEPYWKAREVSERVEWLNFTALKQAHGLAKARPDLKIPTDLARILPDVMFHTADELEDLIMVADHGRIARPDLAVEIMEEADWFEKGRLAAVKLHDKLLKPRYGTFIVCREAPPQAAFDELAPKPPPAAVASTGEQVQAVVAQPAGETLPATPEALNIHIIVAGYDASRLETVVSALVSAR
jgi:hypothetical protein